jgi:hypothetical protein
VAANQVVEARAAEEAVAAVAKQATEVTAAEEAAAAAVAKQATEVMVAEEATVVIGSDGSSGSGLGVVHGDARRAPDTMSNLKAVGKRPTSMMGLGGSSPPPHKPTSAFMVPGGMPHIFFCRFFLFLSPFFVLVY